MEKIFRRIERYLLKTTGRIFFFIQEPMNSFIEIKKRFPSSHHSITRGIFPKRKSVGFKIVEIIQCKKGTRSSILKEISERGYKPVPVQYFLSIGLIDCKRFELMSRIFCLDPNLNTEGALAINYFEQEEPFLDIWPDHLFGNHEDWYAVISK